MSKDKGFDVNQVMEDMKKDRNLAMEVVGFVAAIVALFLPWYSAGLFGVTITSSPGLNSTGFLILVLSVVGGGAALNVMRQEKDQAKLFALVAAVLVLLIVVSNYPDSSLGSLVKVKIGYWLALLGSISATVGAVMKKRESSSSTSV